MGRKKPSKKQLLAEFIRTKGIELVDESVWEWLKAALAPITDSYLRKLLRESGVPLSPLVEGVRQENLQELERTLLQLSEIYARARQENNFVLVRRVRDLVIEARQHASWAKRREQARGINNPLRAEVLLWLLTWLENPLLFPTWVCMRKRTQQHEQKENRRVGSESDR